MEIFFFGGSKSRNCWILIDELGCVFNVLLKKKTHPNSSLKIQKGVFFCPIWRKKKLSRKYELINNGIYFREIFFFKINKKTHLLWFWVTNWGAFFFNEFGKNAPQFGTQNRPKYHYFYMSVQKKRTFF